MILLQDNHVSSIKVMIFFLQIFVCRFFIGGHRLLGRIVGLLAALLADVRTLRPVPPAAAHRRRLRQRTRRAAVIDRHLQVHDNDLHFGNECFLQLHLAELTKIMISSL